MTDLPFTKAEIAQAIEAVSAVVDVVAADDAATDRFVAACVEHLTKSLSVAHDYDVDAMMHERARAQAASFDHRVPSRTNDMAAARADRRAVVDPLGVDDDADWDDHCALPAPYSSTRWADDTLDIRIVHDSAITTRNDVSLFLEWGAEPLLPAKIVSTTVADRAEFSRRVHDAFGVTPEDTGL